MTRIVISYWKKPIAFRDADWSAIYEGDEPNEGGAMAVGFGATRVAALADLLRNYPRDEVIEELRERHQPE